MKPARWPWGIGLDKRQARRLRRRLARLGLLAALVAGVLAPTSAHAAGEPPVLYVHGFIASAGCPGIDTSKQSAPLRSVLAARGYSGSVIGVDWLCGDKGGANIKPFSHLPASSFNATMRIEDIAEAFAAYVWATYSSKGLPVSIAAHSMGGLIASYAVKHHPELLVSKVVTWSTPYRGWDKVPGGTMGLFCGGWRQCSQMTAGSLFLTDLGATARPAAVSWTCIGGSPKDNVASIASACGTDFTTSVDYFSTAVVNYSHTSYLTDVSQLVNVTARVNGVPAVVGHSLRAGWAVLS